MTMNPLETYYNKFNEEKRLNSRHGQVEFRTTWDYIHQYLPNPKDKLIRIADIGAGTGRYAYPLAQAGYQVTAIEPVRHNQGRIAKKVSDYNKTHEKPLALQAILGNALKLSRFEDESFDATLLLGPMYHLCEESQKLIALREAKRITRKGGPIFVAYLMNEYGVLLHGFRDRHIMDSLQKEILTEDFHILHDEEELYSYVRLEDVNRYNQEAGLTRVKVLTPDGPANYMRREVNALSEEEFECFYRYHRATCERPELLGAAAHLLDIVKS